MKMIAALVSVFLFFSPIAIFGADFDGDSRSDLAIFRPSSGLWAVRGVTRVYFGGSSDEPRPGDYNGDGVADIAIFRGSSGLWAVRDVTRVYFGGSTDTPIQGGGGQRTYDYVVRAGDGDDLERALESTTYDSVFIPAGNYFVSDPIIVTYVTRITGESREKTIIYFSGNNHLAIGAAADGCLIEKITVQSGGESNIGNFFIGGSSVTVRDCRSRFSLADAFLYTSGASFITFDNCLVEDAAFRGFQGNSSVRTSKLINCSVVDSSGSITGSDVGFEDCYNLTNCYVEGESYGYSGCYNISSSIAFASTDIGFNNCYGLSSCQVIKSGDDPLYGMKSCQNLSACRVEAHVTEYTGCDYYYTGTGGNDNSCD